MLKVVQIPAFEDNYFYLLHIDGLTAVIDPGAAKPVNQFLEKHGWKLDYIWNTHHHHDHVGGNLELKKKWQCRVIGPKADKHRIPGMDTGVSEGEIFMFGHLPIKVIEVHGHTLGHIAFYLKDNSKLFCGDALFAMGCGRVYEGTHEQKWQSLQKIKALPQDTEIYCAHEYTKKNAEFSLSVLPSDQGIQARYKEVCKKREEGIATVPFRLVDELKTNLFLRTKTVAEFSSLRKKRDVF